MAGQPSFAETSLYAARRDKMTRVMGTDQQ
jgi:hypothetical protein